MEKVGATYYHRRTVPTELRPYFLTATGKERIEFKTSLKTKDRGTADRRLEIEDVRITHLFDVARRHLVDGVTPHSVSAQATAKEIWEEEQFDFVAKFDAEMSHLEYQEQAEDSKIAAWLGRPHDELSQTERALKRNIDPAFFDSAEIQRSRAIRNEAKAAQGAILASEAFLNGALRHNAPKYPTLLSLFEGYATDGDRPPAPATLKAWRRHMIKLISFLQHDDASRLTREDVLRWRDYLVSERSKEGILRSAKTINDSYLSGLRTILSWAVSNIKLKENVAQGVAVRTRKKPKLRDPGLTDEEAKIILRSTHCTPPQRLSEGNKRARRWVPWLCAYTGARVGEITQLRKGDVYIDNGVWALRITPEAGTVKSQEARIVPVHSHLIEMGFIKFVQSIQNAPIFFDPLLHRGGLDGNPQSSKVSERLAKWIRSIGVTDKNVQPNHGWRHRFKTEARSAGLDPAARDAIQGHAEGTEGEKYGLWKVEALRREIEKLPRYLL